MTALVAPSFVGILAALAVLQIVLITGLPLGRAEVAVVPVSALLAVFAVVIAVS